ncbi:S4 domain-containing protein YaaA [Halanaerocella petrolearia]
MQEVKIKTETINLDQFLKWANLVSTGGEAKVVVQAGKVKVNGEVEEKRARTLTVDDVVEYRGTSYQVTSS